MTKTSELGLEALDRFVGTWTTEATHPAFPDLVVHGTAQVEWLEGERFLIHRARVEHPDFPDAISIIGFTDRDRADDAQGTQAATAGTEQLTMHYFDSRGVSRVYEVEADAASLRFRRMAPEFSQRFIGTFSDGDTTMVGRWQLCRDEQRWEDDLQITYRRRV